MKQAITEKYLLNFILGCKNTTADMLEQNKTQKLQKYFVCCNIHTIPSISLIAHVLRHQKKTRWDRKLTQCVHWKAQKASQRKKAATLDERRASIHGHALVKLCCERRKTCILYSRVNKRSTTAILHNSASDLI